MQIKERNIGMAILWALLTCGIYTIYWIMVVTDDIARLANDSKISGGKTILFSILTCGIYTLFWYYQMGQLIGKAKRDRGLQEADDKGLLYLVLGLFGLGIVSLCLMQSEVNQMATPTTLN